MRADTRSRPTVSTLLRRIFCATLAAVLASASAIAVAAEGMWTFNDFPSAKVAAAYGFEPTTAWLDHLRLSSLRVAGGCSASAVSKNGLVMTNHHCARGCITHVSAITGKDGIRDGFFAATIVDEPRCTGMELNQLLEITDVTARVQAATTGADPQRFADVQRAAIAAIERQCATSAAQRCEVVSLYRGGRYDLYRYRRFQDIRLVFAPEESAAAFGGDPDNFMFPRYDLDVSFVRIYDNGKPMQTPDHLTWSRTPVREGELTFVAGHPGGTSRGKTIAQIDDDRDWRLPAAMNRVSELRGYLTAYQQRGDVQKRDAAQALFGAENYLKAMKGEHAALATPAFHARLADAEATLRAQVAADPKLAQAYGGVWDRIAALVVRDQALRPAFGTLENGVNSKLFGIARGLVRYAGESTKPNGERLPEFTEARLPQFRQRLLANDPIDADFEIATLTWSLTRMREELGADHPAVRRVLGRHTPAEVARTAVTGTHVGELTVDAAGNPVGGLRKALIDGGKPVIDASTDPMLALVRSFDADALAARARYEAEVIGPMNQQQELLAQARFAVEGTSSYPDATFTLRLSFGSVKGYVDGEATVPPFTDFAGAFARDTGAEPFALPPTWWRAKPTLRPDLPLDFVTDNDVIGGNSGSPMVDRRGDVVGLVFDGNRGSLGGRYGFEAAINRTVAVSAVAIVEALREIYHADRLLDELGIAPAAH